MKTLDISTRLLSEAAWNRILETAAPQFLYRGQKFFELMASLEALRKAADYNTGSISAAAAWSLYSLVGYFGPQRILEIGTFIGKSTLAMALAADDLSISTEIHTCDMSNSIELPTIAKTRIIQYPKQTSTQMLQKLTAANSGAKFEMLYLDGRLQSEDFSSLAKLCSPGVIVVCDDFEGHEKGVANLINARNGGLIPQHILIYPPSETLLQKFGLSDHSTTAFALPQAALRLTTQ